MANDEYEKVELPAIEQLETLGWTYISGEKFLPDQSTERSSLKRVILKKPD